jgi:uncharacterized membrane protein
MLIMAIPKIPYMIRNINSNDIRERIDTENLMGNISRIRDDVGLDEKLSRITNSGYNSKTVNKSGNDENSDSGIIMIGGSFTSEEKERTVLILQILSAAFVVVSILSIFHFISIIIYVPLGVIIVGSIIYLLYNRIKLMYSSEDFPAYRDFFLMYVAVGIILVLLNTNSNFVMAFSFQLLPSLSVLIFAVVAVLAVFLIFRLRYYRNFTYGTVVEGGKNTAYVKVEYDIRSNVKPDIYIVENRIGAVEGDTVKLKLEEKLMSMGGNKPVSILENANII